jgi:hypothetical protein
MPAQPMEVDKVPDASRQDAVDERALMVEAVGPVQTLPDTSTFSFKHCHPVLLLTAQKIKSISVKTQLNSIYYIELHVSTYLRLSSGSQLVFKIY